jgi:hypothetical protein
MALKARAADSVGGPDGQSCWQCLDETIIVALQATLGTTAVVYPVSFAPQPSLSFYNSGPVPDVLNAGSPIATLEGGQLMNIGAATLALQATMATGLFVVRAGAIVGGTIAFGWRATAAAPTTVLGIASVPLGGDAGTPAFTLPTPVLQMPAVAANTALVNVTAGSFLLLQPGDFIGFLQVMQTGTLATPALAVSARVR